MQINTNETDPRNTPEVLEYTQILTSKDWEKAREMCWREREQIAQQRGVDVGDLWNNETWREEESEWHKFERLLEALYFPTGEHETGEINKVKGNLAAMNSKKFGKPRKIALDYANRVKGILQQSTIKPPERRRSTTMINAQIDLNKSITKYFRELTGEESLDDIVGKVYSLFDNAQFTFHVQNSTVTLYNIGKWLTKEGICITPENRNTLIEVILFIEKKLKNSVGEMGGRNIGNALYGLRDLSDAIVPKTLLEAIEKRINTMDGEMDGQGIGNALYGLQNLHSESAEQLKSYFFGLIEAENKEESTLFTDIDYIYFMQLYSFYEKPPSRIFRKRYQKAVREKRTEAGGRKENENNYEAQAFPIIKEIFPLVEGNIFPVPGFECDFLISAGKQTINIELDGKYHVGAKVGRDRRRDEHLHKHGIRVIRISYPVDNIETFSDYIRESIMGILFGINNAHRCEMSLESDWITPR